MIFLILVAEPKIICVCMFLLRLCLLGGVLEVLPNVVE